MTLLSRLLGFVRDAVIANLFGAGAAADAFFVAFRIPNFFRRLFAEGAFSQAFVPVLAEYKVQRSHPEVKLLVDRVAGAMLAILAPATVFCMLAAPLFVLVFAPGFMGVAEKFDAASAMLRITFPYLLLISLAALGGAVLNTYGRYAAPALTPVFLNLAMIASALLLAPRLEQPVMALAWGVLLGGVLQCLFQLPFLAALGLLPRPRSARHDPGVGRILSLMTPAVFGVSVAQINLLVDTLIASFLATGSVSWLYYSDRLVEFPLGLFGVAIATVVLPALAHHHAGAGDEAFSHTLDWGLRLLLVMVAPCAAGLAVLAAPAICTLFQYGEMTGHDVEMAGRSLTAYALGLLPFCMVKVLAPGFYARQDTRTPVRVGIAAMVANLVLNLLLVLPLAHAGLALATSLAAALNAGLLLWILVRRGVYRPRPGWARFLLRIALAAALMSAALIWLTPDLDWWLAQSLGRRLFHLAKWIGLGVVLYFAALALAGLRVRDVMPGEAKV